MEVLTHRCSVIIEYVIKLQLAFEYGLIIAKWLQILHALLRTSLIEAITNRGTVIIKSWMEEADWLFCHLGNYLNGIRWPILIRWSQDLGWFPCYSRHCQSQGIVLIVTMILLLYRYVYSHIRIPQVFAKGTINSRLAKAIGLLWFSKTAAGIHGCLWWAGWSSLVKYNIKKKKSTRHHLRS